MADIDTVLERLVTDAAFRVRLGSDPAAALAGYDLTADDLELLASSLDDTDSGQRGVEQRTSKSAVLGLLASLTGGGGGGTGELRDPPRLDGASKDTAYLGDAAPDGETEAVTGYGKIEDIKGESSATEGTASYSQRYRGLPSFPDAIEGDTAPDMPAAADVDSAPGGAEPAAAFIKFPDLKDGATDVPDDEAGIRKVSGQKKYSNITLKRGADATRMPGAQLAPADDGGESDLAFKQGWPVKWQGADHAPDETDAPPIGSGDVTNAWPKKVEIGAMKAGDTGARGAELGLPGSEDADPTQAGDFDGDGRTDLSGGPVSPPASAEVPDAPETTTPPGETKPQDDFLTIEDA